MDAALELESTLTDRYQTTVPNPVRRALKLRKRDKIRYVVQPDGTVLITRALPVDTTDPVLENFLQFLARDMTAHPEHIKGISASLAKQARELTRKVKMDLNAPLAAEDE
jgi:antitoxin PrlF